MTVDVWHDGQVSRMQITRWQVVNGQLFVYDSDGLKGQFRVWEGIRKVA